MLEENEEKAGTVYKMVDHLVFSYLNRREYKNAGSGICSDSMWLRRRDPERPVLVQGSLHEKSLEDIVELFYHYGRFDVPAEFMYMEQQLRQISNQFTESLVNFSQTNKKRFQERHSRFMLNQRRSRQGETVGERSSRPENVADLNQGVTVGQAQKMNGHQLQEDFVLPTASVASMYSQQQSFSAQNSSVPYSSDDQALVEDGSSRRKSKPTKHHAQNVVKIIETIGTNKLQMRESKQIGEDNWDLGNDFEQLFQEFYPDMEVCNQMVLDVFDQGPGMSLLDEMDEMEESTVKEKSREVIHHQLQDSVEQIVMEFDERDHPVTESALVTETVISSELAIPMEKEFITVLEPVVEIPESTEPVETILQTKKVVEALPESESDPQKNTVVPKRSRMEDLFGREDGELTQSPKILTKPERVGRSPTSESQERHSTQSISKAKPRNLLESIERNPKLIERSRSPLRQVERPRVPSSSDIKESVKATERTRGELSKVSRIDEDRRRELDRREERLREKQRVTERERDGDRAKEKDRIEREKKREQDKIRSSKKESEDRTFGSQGRRLSAASTSSSSSAIEDRSPRPVIKNRSPRPKETRKLSPKLRRSPVREKPKEERKKIEDRETESWRRTTDTKGQSNKIADKNEPDVVIRKDVETKIISSRHASDAVFHQMYPSNPKFQNQIKIPKMKISRETSAPELSKTQTKEPEVVIRIPKTAKDTAVKESSVILSRPPVVPVEERENTPEKVPELSKGIIDPLLKNRIPKCTMSDSRLACMLSNVQQRRESMAGEPKEDEARKRSAEEAAVETAQPPTENEHVNRIPKRRKINLEEAEEMLKRIHGS